MRRRGPFPLRCGQFPTWSVYIFLIPSYPRSVMNTCTKQDAVVTFTLNNADNSLQLACVTGELWNGRTIQLKIISILTATVSLALIALASLRQLLHRGTSDPTPTPVTYTDLPGIELATAPVPTPTQPQPVPTAGPPQTVMPSPQSSVYYPAGASAAYGPYVPFPAADDPSQSRLIPIMEAAGIHSVHTMPSVSSDLSGFNSRHNYPQPIHQDTQYQSITQQPLAPHVPPAAPGYNATTSFYGSPAVNNMVQTTTTPYQPMQAGAAVVPPLVPSDNHSAPAAPLPNPHDRPGQSVGSLSPMVNEVHTLPNNVGDPATLHTNDVSPIFADDLTNTYAHEAPAGRMDPIALFLHFQYISSSGLLSVRYPTLYRAFTANFAWANLLLPVGIFRGVVNKLRKCELVEDSRRTSILDGFSIPIVFSQPSVGGYLGIPAYAHLIHLGQQDLFPMAFMVFLCACAALLVLSLVPLALHIAVVASRQHHRRVWAARRDRWCGVTLSNTVRIVRCFLSRLVASFESSDVRVATKHR